MSYNIYRRKLKIDLPAKNLKKIPKLGKLIGSGAYGSIYCFPNDKKKIIKIAEINVKAWKKLEYVLNRLKKIKNFPIMQLDKFQYIGNAGHHKYFYYIGEKLFPPEYFDVEYIRACILNKRKKLKNNKEFKRENELIKGLRKLGDRNLHYYDLHYWNIMEDESGKLKMVDLESFCKYY